MSSAEKLFRHVNPKQQDVFRMNIAVHLQRWEIENLFECLKVRGFQFKDIHITAENRLEKRIAVEWKRRFQLIDFSRNGYLGGAIL